MPAQQCQSYNKKGNRCGLTTKKGDFCWKHVLNPKPIPSYQPAALAAPAPGPAVHSIASRTREASQNSTEIRGTPAARDDSLDLNHGISVTEDVAPAVVITTKVEGSAAPALYQVREIGGDEPRPLQRARTWKDWVPRPLRASVSPRRSNVSLSTPINQLQPENIIRGMGLSSKTRRELLAYLDRTKVVKEALYIACSPQNSQGERRIKIGRTADPDRRRRDYEKCDMKIVWSMRMEHTIRLEKLILLAIKSDFKELGRQSGSTFIQEIQALGRKVVCKCGKSHNDMILTTGRWDDTHLDALKSLVLEFGILDRIESENLFRVEVDEVLQGDDVEGEEKGRDEAREEEGTRAKSEERVAEIHAELVRAQKAWVRGADGRLIRTT